MAQKPLSDLSKKPYADLCGCMASASVVPCLVDLCRALWSIMNSYRQISEWHQREKKAAEAKEESGEEEKDLEGEMREMEACTDKIINIHAPRIWN